MARTAKKEDSDSYSFKDQIDKFLSHKDHKDFHYNDIEDIEDRIPSGSLTLDIAMDGGLPVGIHRHGGNFECGKTAAALSFAANFQKEDPKNTVVYVVSEGRLNNKLLKTSGMKTDGDQWFRFDCNITEVVFDLIKDLIQNNPENRKYFFVIDSSDGLVRKDDLNKPFTDSDKVAGAALTNSVFLKKFSLPITKFGHRMILISQVRITLPMGYGQSAKESQSGGKSIDHYSNFSLEFLNRYKSDLIFEDEKAPREELVITGHWCKVLFKKSDNEKTNSIVKYPVRYHAEVGKSVWIEYEIFDLCKRWGIILKGGAWFSLEDSMKEKLEQEKIPTFEKLHGEKNVFEWLEKEENKGFVDYFYSYFRNMFKNE